MGANILIKGAANCPILARYHYNILINVTIIQWHDSCFMTMISEGLRSHNAIWTPQ